jgi:hypothetical protein
VIMDVASKLKSRYITESTGFAGQPPTFLRERVEQLEMSQVVHTTIWSIDTRPVVVYKEVVINSSPTGGAIAFSTLPNPLSSPTPSVMG